MSNPVNQPSGADGLAHAIRNGNAEEFGKSSPIAACLIPLLEEIHWHGDLRDVAESLPHFASDMDLTDLRNILALLGYTSEPKKIALSKIDSRLLPCLFEDRKSGELFVVTGFEAGEYVLFGAGKYSRLKFDDAKISGTAFFLTQTKDTAEQRARQMTAWFTQALLRFKRSFRNLLIMSFINNLLAISIPLFIMIVYDRVIGSHSLKTLPFLAGGIVVVLISDLLLRQIRAQVIGAVSGRLDYLLGVAAFEKVISLPPSFIEHATISTQISRLRQFENLRDFFAGPLITSAIEAPFVVVTLAVIAVLAGPMVIVPIVAIGLYVLFGWLWLPHTRRINREQSATNQARHNFILETATKLRTIKELGAEEIWRNRYRILSSTTLTLQNKAARQSAVTAAVSHGIMMLSGVAVLGFGALAVLSEVISIGGLIATMALVWRALTPIQSGFLALAKLSEIRNSLAQVNLLMKLNDESKASNVSHVFSRDLDGDVIIERVSFRYSPDTDPALLGATMKFQRGTVNAILGTNSSGKSTILKMINGLYQPQGGLVSIAGTDVRQIAPLDLRRKISYVPQRPEIYYGTITQNLRLADPMASEDRLKEAADLIGLTEMIDTLPEGMETRINAFSNDNLPPGFIHRLCIARALVRDTAILLLDEPEASLDSTGDRMLTELFQNLKGKKTVVFVSHRPSHIKLADSAVVLNRGVVEFNGSPEQALQAMAIITSNARAA